MINYTEAPYWEFEFCFSYNNESSLESRMKNLAKSKEIKHNWTRPKNFDFFFCLVIGH